MGYAAQRRGIEQSNTRRPLLRRFVLLALCPAKENQTAVGERVLHACVRLCTCVGGLFVFCFLRDEQCGYADNVPLRRRRFHPGAAIHAHPPAGIP